MKVFIKDLNQFGKVVSYLDGKPEKVIITDEDGNPKIINVIEKGYIVLSGLIRILLLILNILKY